MKANRHGMFVFALVFLSSGAMLLAASGPLEEVMSSGRISSYGRISYFQDDYSYTAYQHGIVVRHSATGRTEAVAVSGDGFPLRPGFQRALDKDPVLAGRLGGSLSPVVSLFDGKVQAQLFEGGAMLYEALSNNNWWNWHARRQLSTGPSVIALPKEPGAWVISLDYRGGYTPPRKNQDPFLLIRNDGRVTVNDPFGMQPRIETRISVSQVHELLRFALVQNDFFSLNGAAIDKAVNLEIQRKRVPRVTDLPKTVMRMRTFHQQHEVQCYAVGFYADKLPELASLQKLHRIEQRLSRFMDQLRGE